MKFLLHAITFIALYGFATVQSMDRITSKISRDDFADGLLSCSDYTGASAAINCAAACLFSVPPLVIYSMGVGKVLTTYVCLSTLPCAAAFSVLGCCCLSAHIYSRHTLKKMSQVIPHYQEL